MDYIEQNDKTDSGKINVIAILYEIYVYMYRATAVLEFNRTQNNVYHGV